MSENHTRAGQNGATSNRLWLPAIDPSFRTLSRTPGSKAIGGKAYRRSLGHVCTMASNPSGAGCVRENHSGQWVVSRDVNNPLPLGRTSCISTSPPRGEISIPRASTPASTGRLLPDSGPRGHTSLSETTVSPWITGGSGAPVCTEGATSDPPDGSNTRPRIRTW